MSKSEYRFHLRSYQSKDFSACGVYGAVTLTRRSIKRVDCKNCRAIIDGNKPTKFFRAVEESR